MNWSGARKKEKAVQRMVRKGGVHFLFDGQGAVSKIFAFMKKIGTIESFKVGCWQDIYN